jgi:hypothetical protein
MTRVRVFFLPAATLVASLTFAPTALAQAPPAAPTPAQAQDVQQVRDEVAKLKQDFDLLRQQYDDRLAKLEERLKEIGGSSGPAAATVQNTGAAKDAATAAPPVLVPADAPVLAQTPDQSGAGQASLAGSSKVFNPDTSVIANFVGVAGKNPMSTQPAMQLSEAEVSFQAIIDPYAKADFFLSAGPEGLDVEEGYITFTSLPGNLLLKVGKMRAQFGKVNTLHSHAMPTADRPLVTENLVGGEDGLSDAGMSVSHLVQTSALYLELTGEVFAGTSNVFQSQQRSDLNYVGRVRAYHDLTENSNIDLGTSFAFGPTDVGQTTTLPAGVTPTTLNKSLYGIDATYRYRPLRRAIYKRLNLRTELIWSKQDLPSGDQTTAFGWYGLAEYQFARRWYLGARFDQSGRTLDGSLHDNGGSFFMTFWPSEFSQIRGQYRLTNYAEGVRANEFLFQFNFAIGAHGAHIF